MILLSALLCSEIFKKLIMPSGLKLESSFSFSYLYTEYFTFVLKAKFFKLIVMHLTQILQYIQNIFKGMF